MTWQRDKKRVHEKNNDEEVNRDNYFPRHLLLMRNEGQKEFDAQYIGVYM